MLRCPKCESNAGFLIETQAVQAFDKYGHCKGNYTEPKVSAYAMCTCMDCDYEGIVLDFQDTSMEDSNANL